MLWEISANNWSPSLHSVDQWPCWLCMSVWHYGIHIYFIFLYVSIRFIYTYNIHNNIRISTVSQFLRSVVGSFERLLKAVQHWLYCKSSLTFINYPQNIARRCSLSVWCYRCITNWIFGATNFQNDDEAPMAVAAIPTTWTQSMGWVKLSSACERHSLAPSLKLRLIRRSFRHNYVENNCHRGKVTSSHSTRTEVERRWKKCAIAATQWILDKSACNIVTCVAEKGCSTPDVAAMWTN